MIMPAAHANTSSTLKLYSLNLNLGTRKKVIVHYLITFIHEVTDLSETKIFGTPNWKKLMIAIFAV